MAGLIIAAPQSGTGKTVVTLGLLRLLRQRGLRVAAAKTGPDYIDPSFLAAAGGGPCRNLDAWAMRRETLGSSIRFLESEAAIVLCEGVMGLFDGAGFAAAGSTADLALASGWPVIFVVDVSGQSASAAALVEGFARHRAGVTIAGVILNRVGSERHRAMVEAALCRALPAMKILGALPRVAALDLPSRHLGLVPAAEHQALEAFLDGAAAHVAEAIDLDALLDLARPATIAAVSSTPPIPPLGQRIAIARDQAFAFAYDGVLQGWRAAGVALSFFSPLAGELPASDADAIYLPGGYPELFVEPIASHRRFLDGLRHAAQRGTVIYGECGGYMVLGESLIDGAGKIHAMAGLLPVKTSFAARKRHLGYRIATLAAKGPLGAAGQGFRGHEFHYATIVDERAAAPLFDVADPDETALGRAGCVAGTVMGSFIHLIDRA